MYSEPPSQLPHRVSVRTLLDDPALGLNVQRKAADMPASGKLTEDRLGWKPKQPGLIADLDHPRYFQA